MNRDFNLETLSYQQLFEGLKDGIAKAISKISKQEILPDDLILNGDRCSMRFAYAEDGNLYPKIYLSIKGSYDILITPFEIDVLELTNKLRLFGDWELREFFYNFMCKQFPNSNYEKFYEIYQKDCEIAIKTRDINIFL